MQLEYFVLGSRYRLMASEQNWNKTAISLCIAPISVRRFQKCSMIGRRLPLGNLSTRRSWYHGRQPEVFLQHVKTFLSCGHGHQNVSSQAETRGSNSGFFKEYSSYKSKNSSSEIMFSSKERNKTSRKSLKDIFKWIILSAFVIVSRWCDLIGDLHLARKPRPRSSSAPPAMPSVNQERLVVKFPTSPHLLSSTIFHSYRVSVSR